MRIILAGTGSNCGKTTCTLALMGYLMGQGLSIAPYKVGPDYIDPGFHRAVCGRPSHNLDEFLMDPPAIAYLLGEAGQSLAVIEGVMGFYDGMDAGLGCSTYSLARLTHTPVVLVVDGSGSAASAAAQALGFAAMAPESQVAGVLVNRVYGPEHYQLIRQAVDRYAHLPCLGYLPQDPALNLDSRHLGLVPAQETPGLAQVVERAAGLLRLDAQLLLEIARRAPALSAPPPPLVKRPGYRLGVALDGAFSFYYQANLDALVRAGMELVFFSPLADSALPAGLDGLYLGGGFPEVFARRLQDNRSMRRSVREALEDGLPCYAECGGLIYLSRQMEDWEMAGFLPVRCAMTAKLQRFGYVRVEDQAGHIFPAHEFHYAMAHPLEPLDTAFAVTRASDPAQRWRCGYRKKNTVAGFPHLHFLSHPQLIQEVFP